MTFDIERDPKNGMVAVLLLMDGFCELNLLLDTGASHTTLDSNELHLAGYDLREAFGNAVLETANGAVNAQLFTLDEAVALGITRKNFTVQVYDFLAHGMYSNYQGLLGMDFFEGTKFCIDTVNEQVSIEIMR